MKKIPCIDYSQIAVVFILCFTIIVVYYLYINKQVKMLANNPDAKNKITVRVLAAGFTMAYSIMLLPTSREALDFVIYGLKN